MKRNRQEQETYFYLNLFLSKLFINRQCSSNLHLTNWIGLNSLIFLELDCNGIKAFFKPMHSYEIHCVFGGLGETYSFGFGFSLSLSPLFGMS
jgi:hypothetical protein